MRRARPSRDIRPLSEFRANVATFVEQVQSTGRPLILTQHGRGAAILLSIAEYEDLTERAELAEDIRLAESQITAKAGVAHGRALVNVRARVKRAAATQRAS